MTERIRRLTAYGLAALLALLPLLTMPTAARAYVKGEDARVDAAQAAMEDVFSRLDTVGASVAAAREGKILAVFNYGRILGGDKSAVTNDTYFKIASCTKLVSAVGIMQLVERGLLDLDEDIGVYLGYTVRNPRYPKQKITLRQIMCHTSGIIDNNAYSRTLSGADPQPLRELLAGKYRSICFSKNAPGAKYEYSNFGGAMLGVFIQLASGQSLDEYMTQNVFAPMGFAAGYTSGALPQDAVFASGAMTAAQLQSEEPAEYAYTHTAGGLCMTSSALCAVLCVLCGNGMYNGARILNEDTVIAMRQCQTGMPGVTAKVDYGLCVQIKPDTVVSTRTMYGHQGMYNNIICGMYYDPEDQTCVAVVSNKSTPKPQIYRVTPLVKRSFKAAYAFLDGMLE